MLKILNISEAASIAIHGLVLIAKNGEKIKASEISDMLKNSKNHTAKILKTLVKFGYLDSGRGPNGGFVFKTKPDQITLLEVYEIFDGKIETQHCGAFSGKCPFETCVFGGLGEKVSTELKNYLSITKISDLINK
jgi:Rrf2 family protein